VAFAGEIVDALAGTVTSFLSLFAPASGAQSPGTTRVTAPAPAARYPTPPAPNKNLAEACQAAELYVLGLEKAGLPPPPGWGALSCEEKVVAVASFGSPANAALAAAFVYGANQAQAIQGSTARAVHDAYKAARHIF
jgi:hypothetical protein